ncbi:MAG: hypothetical protein EOP49_24600, partial [Sphingobacteriales bacterium]
MRIFLLFIALFLVSPIRAQSLFLKYSKLDCAYCNLQLMSIGQLKGVPVKIVLKSADRADSGLEEMVKQVAEMGLVMHYDDALYYSMDSSERSMVYLLDKDNQVLYQDLLKDIRTDKIRSLLPAAMQAGNIYMPGLTMIRQSARHLYFGDGKLPYLLRIGKERGDRVQDTVRLDPAWMKEAIYKAYFGKTWKAELDSFMKLATLGGIPLT